MLTYSFHIYHFHSLTIYQFFSQKNPSFAQFIPRIYNKIIIKIIGYFWGITRDAAYWEDSNIKEVDLVRMLETRDKGIQDSMVSRDRAWLNSLHSCNESLRLMTRE